MSNNERFSPEGEDSEYSEFGGDYPSQAVNG
jgi:hypothetical protein